MVNSFNQHLDLYRPLERHAFSEGQSYFVVELKHVKLAQPSDGWTVSTNGTVQSKTATLYYNIAYSSAEPVLETLFKAGDVIVRHGGDVDGERRVVQSVTEQWFRGRLHHYEVVLV